MPKDIRLLSKRRRNQLLRRKLNHIMNDSRNNRSEDNSINISINNFVSNNFLQPLNGVIQLNNVGPLNSVGQLNNVRLLNSVEQFDHCHKKIYESTNQVKNLSDKRVNEEIIEINTASFDSSVVNENNVQQLISHNISLKDELRSWVLQQQIAHRAVNDLLTIFRRHGFNELPQDVRTLMKTPRNATNKIKYGNGGAYMHFGIANGLERSIKKYFVSCPSTIGLQLNCDGISVSNSSSSQFWPLLMAIDADFYTQPFLVGLFHGNSKPIDANIFLMPFVLDMLCIMQEGLIINNKKINVQLTAIICDAPAKAFITCTKYPTGYFSCLKCIQEGDWNGRVFFPEMTSDLRTDESFDNMRQEEHHSGISVLKNLKIGMVSKVALDYMHLVCLGVVKRLLQLWTKGPRDVRLTANQINIISKALLETRTCIPVEFARQPRSLDVVEKWKATEFRQFLLYTGPIILKDILIQKYYQHFLTFSAAIRILCDPYLCIKHNNYANSLLKWFVEKFKVLYGVEYLTHNIHNLLHLSNEVKSFGCLDQFSCFKFENYMSIIKGKIQNAPKPLEQVVNRQFEENYLPIVNEFKKIYPIIHYVENTSKIKSLEYNGFRLSKEKNANICLLSDSCIFYINDFYVNQKKILWISGNKCIDKKCFSSVPCDFVLFNIYQYDSSCKTVLVTVKASTILSKCIIIKHPVLDYKVNIPFLQCNN